MFSKQFHSYQTILQNESIHFLIANETDWGTTSLLLPTLCFSRPAYVQFASPITSLKNEQEEVSPPSHWWAVAAENNQLIFFTTYQNQPFALTQRWQSQIISLRDEKKRADFISQTLPFLEKDIEALAEFFFIKTNATEELKKSFWQHFEALVTDQQNRQQYQTLAPDFFQWVALPEPA